MTDPTQHADYVVAHDRLLEMWDLGYFKESGISVSELCPFEDTKGQQEVEW